MQQNCFQNLGLQNQVQLFPYQLPYQNYVQYPEIVGEGEVTPLVLPDGSLQYIFVPTYKRDLWLPRAFSPLINNRVNWNLNTEAWFIRNVSNPLPGFYFSQQFPRAYGDQQMRSSLPNDCSPLTLSIGYQNKFHYDQCTSTTDLHYFYPNVRPTKQTDYQSVCLQIDTPMREIVHYEVCSKPCNCTACTSNVQNAVSHTKSREHIERRMSVDEVPINANNVKCKYGHLGTTDKMLSTYTDKASGSNEDKCSNKREESRRNFKSRRKADRKHERSTIKVIDVCDGCCCCESCTTEDE